MNQSVLSQKIRALKLYPRLSSSDLDRLEVLLPTMGPWDLLRINPYRFAEVHGFRPKSLLDILIHGSKVGLFDFRFGQICPGCGGIEHNHSRLDAIEDESIHCTVCNRQVTSSMDDFLEVSFAPSEALGVPEVNPLGDLPSYLGYYHSENFQLDSSVRGEVQKSFLGFVAIDPDEQGALAVDLDPGREYRLMNLESHSQLVVFVDGKPLGMEQVVDIDLLSSGLSPSTVTLAPGRAVFKVSNRFRSPTGMAVQEYQRFKEVQLRPGNPAPQWRRFLTGKAFLNNQSFRELFRIQAYAPDMKLKIKSLTVLFTDLKGSTDMYGRVGDIRAFDMVQKHFVLLTEVVREYEGAIVKTMGDAIMATFSTSQDGVLASLEIVKRMAELQRSVGNQELGIKIGLHEGPALAVNADERLDYFGQNINLAARVQGLADSGEIWMTDAVFTSPGVAETLQATGLLREQKMATLKGIPRPTPVHRIWGPIPAL